MTKTNALVKASSVVKFLVNGRNIELSPEIIRAQLVPEDSKITDQEIGMFMHLCDMTKLNPFINEVYIVKYGTSPAAFVTGKSAFMKRAKKDPTYRGHKGGISDDGKVAWAEVYIKDFEVPVRCEVDLDEYIGKKANGEVNSMWTKKPRTMLKKCALVAAMRDAFPLDLSNLYEIDEIPREEIKEADVTSVTSAESKSDKDKKTTKPAKAAEKKSTSSTTTSAPPSVDGEAPLATPDGEAPATGEVKNTMMAKIKDVTMKSGGEGRDAWTKFGIETVGGTWFSTFDADQAKDARAIIGKDQEACLAYDIKHSGGKEYFNLKKKGGITIMAAE